MIELNENSRIGVLYKIEGYGDIYYGSTIQPISERKSTHKRQYEAWVKRGRTGWVCSSCIILDKGDEWDLTPLKYILTDNKKTGLLELENENINTKVCVNKIQSIQSIEDLKEYKRKWAEENRREKGIKPKIEGFDKKKYARDWAKAKRACLTDEEREKINAKRRETRNPEKDKEYMKSLTDEQKEKRAEGQRIRRANAKAGVESD